MLVTVTGRLGALGGDTNPVGVGTVTLCEARQTRSLIPVGQIAKASSSNAARTRRFTVSPPPRS